VKQAVGFLISLALFLTGGTAAGDVIEVSPGLSITDNSNYDRNPSLIYDGSSYWLFYTKADSGGVRGDAGYDPDTQAYSIHYKTAADIEDLGAGLEQSILGSNPLNRPANFDQRVSSATYFDGKIYVFASSGQSGTDRGLYYYLYDSGSWSGEYLLIADATARGGHVNVTSDADRMYIVWESTDGSSDLYTFDGTNLSSKVDIDDGNMPKITLKGGATPTLYVVNIEDATGDVEVFSASPDSLPSFAAHSTAISGTGLYDPCILNDGEDLLVVTAPYVAPDRQYLVQARYDASETTWSSSRQITYGGYNDTEWWDFWPGGIYTNGQYYVAFTTEGSQGSLSDAEISILSLDWDLDRDHFRNIQTAVDQATSGDTLQIDSAVYAEQVEINKDLTLIGTNSPRLVPPASGLSRYSFEENSFFHYPLMFAFGGTISFPRHVSGAGQVSVDVSGLVFDLDNIASTENFVHLMLRNTSSSRVAGSYFTDNIPSLGTLESMGILVFGSSDVAIDSNTFDSFSRIAIGIHGDSALAVDPTADITGNTITGLGPQGLGNPVQRGISVLNGAVASIVGNEISDLYYTPGDLSATAIVTTLAGPGVSIEGNYVHDCEGALYSTRCDSVSVIDGNDFDQNNYCILLGGDHAVVSDNSFSNQGQGVFLADITNVTVDGNTFTDCVFSVLCDGSSANLDFTANSVTGSTQAGFHFDQFGGSEPTGITITGNRISGNQVGVLNKTATQIDAGSNWWGDASGPKDTTIVKSTSVAAAPRPLLAGDATDVADQISAPSDSYVGTLAYGTGDPVTDNVDYSPWWGGDYLDDDHSLPWVWHLDTAFGSTLQEAINAASSGDSINVYAGTYTATEQAVGIIDKALSIVGAGTTPGFGTELVGGTYGSDADTSGLGNNWPRGLVVAADNVLLSGLRISGFQGDGVTNGGYGIVAHADPAWGSSEATLDNLVITDVDIENCYYGLVGSSTASLSFVGNSYEITADSGIYGVHLTSSTGTVLQNNGFDGGGIWLGDATDATIGGPDPADINNIVNAPHAGIWYGQNFVPGSSSERALIQYNNVALCGGGGIVVWNVAGESADSIRILNNVVSSCAGGTSDLAGLSVRQGDFTNLVIEGNSFLLNLDDQPGLEIKTASVYSGSITENFLSDNGGPGFLLDNVSPSNLTIFSNSVYNNGGGLVRSGSHTGVLDASGNWWGSSDPSLVAAAASGSDSVDFTPWVDSGTDTGAEDGFQADFSSLWVDAASVQSGSQGRISEGLTLLEGTTVNVMSGVYEEQLVLTKSDVSILGTGSGADSTSNSIIRSPAVLSHSFNEGGFDNKAIVSVEGVINTHIDGFRIDGAGRGIGNERFTGVAFYESAGQLSNCVITGVREEPLGSAEHGVGFYAHNSVFGPYTVFVSNCTIDDFQKGGAVVSGGGITVFYDGVDVTGQGSIATIVQNGIQFGSGASGVVTDGTISDISYSPADPVASAILCVEANTVDVDGTTTITNCQQGIVFQESNGSVEGTTLVSGSDENSAGILVRDDGLVAKTGGLTPIPPIAPYTSGDIHTQTKGGPTTVTVDNVFLTGDLATQGYGISSWAYGDQVILAVTNSEITNWYIGAVALESGGTATMVISHSKVAGNDWGFNAQSQGIQTARNNWWGAITGPRNATSNPFGQGNGVSDNVDYDPWCNEDFSQCNYSIYAPHVWVDDDYSEGGANDGHTWQYDAFASIQNGVDRVADDGVITVLPGTYAEQVVIDHSVSIAGSGDPTIAMPAGGLEGWTLEEGDRTVYPMMIAYGGLADTNNHITDTNSIRVNIDGLLLNAGGTADSLFTTGILFRNCLESSLRDNQISGLLPSSGFKETAGIVVYGNSDVVLDSNDVSEWTRLGIGILGDDGVQPDPTATVTGNTIVGRGTLGAGDPVPNGVQISGGASAVVEQNVISDVEYTPLDASAAAIFVVEAASTVEIRGNEIDDCEACVYGLSTDSLLIEGLNIFTGNEGLVLDGCDNASLINNTFDGNNQAIYVTNSSNVNVLSNGLINNAVGVAVDGLVQTIDIDDNTFIFSSSAAIAIAELSSFEPIGVTVYGNRIVSNATGISNSTTHVVNAAGNWWGDISGPERVSGGSVTLNAPAPGSPFGISVKSGPVSEDDDSRTLVKSSSSVPSSRGSGDGVSDNVDYSPWWGEDYRGLPHTNPWIWLVDTVNGSTVQEGIEFASAGDEIRVTSGIFEEQILVTKNDLSIVGSGSGSSALNNTIIRSPLNLTYSFNSGTLESPVFNYPIVAIDGAAGVTLRNLRVNGGGRGNNNSRFVGIGFWNGGGAVDSCWVTGVRNTPFSGAEHGVAIYANNNRGVSYSIDVTETTTEDFQKGGIVLVGNGLTAGVSDCEVTGAGVTSAIAQVGIQVGYGADGTVSACDVSSIAYDGIDLLASGMLFVHGGTVNVAGPGTISACQSHILFEETNGQVDSMTILASGTISSEGIGIRDYGATSAPPDSIDLRKAAPLLESPLDLSADLGVPTTVTVNNCIVTGVDIAGSNGISVWSLGDDVSASVNNCTIENWETGVLASQTGSIVNVIARYNLISGNVTGAFSDAPIAQDFEQNDWGRFDGPLDSLGSDEAAVGQCFDVATMANLVAESQPDSGLGNIVRGAIDYCPWRTASCCLDRGDINYDGQTADIADLVYLVAYMFNGGPEPPCMSTADVNGDGGNQPDIADLVYLVAYMFQGGDALVPCS